VGGRRLRIAIVALVALVAGGALLHGAVLRSMGAWLRVEDRLEHADAIVVLAGGTPRREATAAALWREGWAPRVIISRPFERPDLQELIAMGVRHLDQQGESRKALEMYGVAADRIIAIPEVSRTTEPELALVRDAARRLGYRKLILVSSPEHTRRVKVVWSRQSDSGPEGIVVPARESFPFDHWWRSRRASESILHEYLGLLAITLGISPYFR
jgi:uncharacterized SAM-binding protein YcdF (DUF218 family)